MRNAITLLLLISSPLLAAGSISVTSPPANLTVGSSYTVNVTVAGQSDLYGYQFDLAFDRTRLAAVSVTSGSFLGGGSVFVPGTIDNATGRITFVAGTRVGAVPGASGDGVLAIITFTALSASPGALALSNVTTLDSSLNPFVTSVGVPVIPTLSHGALLLLAVLVAATAYLVSMTEPAPAG